eukprot:2391245-Alexandrium_andersonii.AAC.1
MSVHHSVTLHHPLLPCTEPPTPTSPSRSFPLHLPRSCTALPRCSQPQPEAKVKPEPLEQVLVAHRSASTAWEPAQSER